MVKRTGPTDVYKRALISKLGKTKAPIWKDVAKKLRSPRGRKVEVNVKSISRHAKDGEVVVVPGVVLASGDINKKVNVAAWKFSPSAEKKIKAAKGATMSIEELMKKNPKGSNVRIMV